MIYRVTNKATGTVSHATKEIARSLQKDKDYKVEVFKDGKEQAAADGKSNAPEKTEAPAKPKSKKAKDSTPTE